jgi:very-short-patch-repair endonuclease
MSLKNAKTLRKNMTEAERRLWYYLRAHRFGGYKFKRQVPVGPYVVDFACLSYRLVLEIDGGQHADCRRDAVRGAWLKRDGFQVPRFWNNEVLQQTSSVLQVIVQTLQDIERKSPSPGALRAPPSPLRGEGNAPRGTAETK